MSVYLQGAASVFKHVNKFCFLIVSVIVLVTGVFGQQDDEFGGPQVNIAAEKDQHYTKNGLKVLPRYPDGGRLLPGNYVAIDDFVVNQGQKVSISEGTRILFEAGKRLVIEGQLIVTGTKTNSVSFSNVPYNISFIPINKADSLWGGINVESTGKIELSNTNIANAINGISCANDSSSITLSCVTFTNITTPLLVSGIPRYQSDITCIDFSQVPKNSILTKNNLPVPKRKLNPHISVSFGVTALLLTGGGIVAHLASKDNYDKALHATMVKKADDYATSSDMYADVRNACLIASALSAGACIWINLPFGTKRK